MGRMDMKRLAHPPCSPVLTACDFWFFGLAKTVLLDRRFADADADALIEPLTNVSDSITFDELQSAAQD
jgi:hypothetical protein